MITPTIEPHHFDQEARRIQGTGINPPDAPGFVAAI